ncbi:MAG: hypothetical protein L6R36_008322 [Xanthoria steineri]|nr:MAG: hypothetical protein L6R36_008322 [Xanthoria steineri]
MAPELTAPQLRALETTERVASCFSVTGTIFIMLTFTFSPAFRKPINRLIFFASWGNALCNVATLMSQSGIRAGPDSHLCQFQGFLIQLFLPADALWNLAMAINVYMTLFRKYNAQQLRALEWKYQIMCYGLPFVVALSYLLIDSPKRGKIYGDASLWCWISTEWINLRIALLYAPAWIAILISFTLYAISGREIFQKRRQLRAFHDSPPLSIEVANPFTSFKTTEVEITSELASLPSRNHAPYSVRIFSSTKSPMLSDAATTIDRTSIAAKQNRTNRAAMEANTAAWGYTKVALLFFVSLLITWVPSSINRVYSLIYRDSVSIPFTYASAVVLPLMGFWNTVIYITTSWSACKDVFFEAFFGARRAHRVPRLSTWKTLDHRGRSRDGDTLGVTMRKETSMSDSTRGLAYGDPGNVV